MRKTALLCIWAALLVLSCSTKEIGERPLFISDRFPNSDHGGLQITFAPRADVYNEGVVGEVFMDGVQLADDQSGFLQPLLTLEGGREDMGYLPAGRHHFEIEEVRLEARGPTFFSGDGEIAAGAITELYLFGRGDAVEGRFISLPAVVAPGTAHVNLINLIRAGQSLEVVSCMEGSPCVPVSAPLALGEAFAGDFPVDSMKSAVGGEPVVSNGAALGYRQVPSGAVPDPPVKPLSYNYWYDWGRLSPPTNIAVAAPYWMSPTGDVQGAF
jgi:hypothetical protein